MGVYFFFKNVVSICVTLHKGVMIWLGKDEDEIEEYVITEAYSPEPEHRLMGASLLSTLMYWVVSR